jgi:hypothetical protein
LNAPSTLHCIRHGKYVGAVCPDCALDRAYRLANKGVLGVALMEKLNAWKRDRTDDADVLLAFEDFIQQKLEADPYPAIMARIAALMESDPTKGTPEGDELLALVDTAEMYERQRCPELSTPK